MTSLKTPAELPDQAFRIRSFVRRSGRRTEAQERAHEALWPQFGLTVGAGLLDLEACFGREAERFLEIGFGMGQSLLAIAKAAPDKDFIGVETHRSGIGSLLLGVEQAALTNLRVYDADVVDVLAKCIPDASLAGVQLFFPDPWQKRRHHARRLIQADFINTLATKLKPGGELHLATDWEDYAIYMMRIMAKADNFINLAGIHAYAARSPFRPILTKFEKRALREGRQIWDMQFSC